MESHHNNSLSLIKWNSHPAIDREEGKKYFPLSFWIPLILPGTLFYSRGGAYKGGVEGANATSIFGKLH